MINLFSYIVWYQRGYQEFQEPRGTSVTKVKGVSSVQLTTSSLSGRRFYRTVRSPVNVTRSFHISANYSPIVWDSAEYGIPPLVCILGQCIFDNLSYLFTRKTMHFSLQLVKLSLTIRLKATVRV